MVTYRWNNLRLQQLYVVWNISSLGRTINQCVESWFISVAIKCRIKSTEYFQCKIHRQNKLSQSQIITTHPVGMPNARVKYWLQYFFSICYCVVKYFEVDILTVMLEAFSCQFWASVISTAPTLLQRCNKWNTCQETNRDVATPP